MNSFRIGPQFPQINKIRNMKMYFTRIIRIAHLPIVSSVCSMLTHIYICMWLYDNNVMCVVCFVYFLLPSTSLSIYKTTEYQCHSRVHADEYVNVWVYYSLPQIVAHATTTASTNEQKKNAKHRIMNSVWGIFYCFYVRRDHGIEFGCCMEQCVMPCYMCVCLPYVLSAGMWIERRRSVAHAHISDSSQPAFTTAILYICTCSLLYTIVLYATLYKHMPLPLMN